MKVNKELLKGSTSMMVLNLLLNSNMYGYEMIKTLKEKSQNVFELKEGTLYPVVHTLLKKGYISSYDIIAGKRIRVYYKLEASGKDYLISVREEFKKNIQGVFDILEYGEGERVDE